jgi:multidrug transporter EmrE-like cation transporter
LADTLRRAIGVVFGLLSLALHRSLPVSVAFALFTLSQCS